MGDNRRRGGGVARHHHRADAERFQFRDQGGGILAGRVAECDQPQELHRGRRSGRHRQHSKTFRLQFVRRRRAPWVKEPRER